MRKTLFTLICLFVFGVGSAYAGPLDISGISGIWTNPTGGQNLTGVGTSTVTWGDGVAPDSGYSFVAGSNISGVPVGSPISLGTFTHYNQTIPSGTEITAIDFVLAFSTNGVPGGVSATFNFAHNETPNNTGTSPADDDIVTITTPIVNLAITQGSDTYFFNLLGFSKDGGATYSSVFSSPEGGNNSAVLYGQVTSSRVPEPSSMLLLSMGLAGIGFAAKRKKAVAAMLR